MRRSEKHQLKLKLELVAPNPDGAPPRKFCVTRTLRAPWSNDVVAVTQGILEEIKNYRGSFIGDMVHGLHSLSTSEVNPIEEETSRSVDVARYAASIIDSLVYAGVRDKLHEELLQEPEILEWDGTAKEISDVSAQEINEADMEKIMMLLEPKMKHALFLISKSIKNQNGS